MSTSSTTTKQQTQSTNNTYLTLSPRQLRITCGITLITGFIFYHYYKTYPQKVKQNAIKQLRQKHIKERTNKQKQIQLRQTQKASYINKYLLLFCGVMRAYNIDTDAIPIDIWKNIMKFCERRPFRYSFGLINTDNLSTNWIGSSYALDGIKCEPVLAPNGLKNAQHRGYCEMGLNMSCMPYNISNAVIRYSFYDYQRELQYHNTVVYTQKNRDLVFLWKCNTHSAIHKQLNGPIPIEYDYMFDVIEINYFDGFKCNYKKHIKLQKAIAFDIYFSNFRKVFEEFEMMQHKFYESLTTKPFGICDNFCLRFRRSDKRKVFVELRLLLLPYNVSKIAVGLDLINPENDNVIITGNRTEMDYFVNGCQFFWHEIFRMDREDITMDKIRYKMKVNLLEAYDDNNQLIESEDWAKYGIID